jgi:hypothetical protein
MKRIALFFVILLCARASGQDCPNRGIFQVSGIWINYAEIALLNDLPSDPAWTYVNEWADKNVYSGPDEECYDYNNDGTLDFCGPNLSNQNSKADVICLAKALVYAKTGTTSYRDEVIQMCMDVMNTEGCDLGDKDVCASGGVVGLPEQGHALALARGLAAYVIAADLVSLPPLQANLFRLMAESGANQGDRLRWECRRSSRVRDGTSE